MRAVPVLGVRHVRRAADWYAGLGFEAEFFPADVSCPGFGILRRDAAEIMLEYRPLRARLKMRRGWDVYLRVATFDGLPPALDERKPYGCIERKFWDPDNNTIVVSVPT